MRGNDGGRAGFPVNDVDLQDGLDILVGEVGSELFLQHRHVAGAGRKLGGSLGAIAADAGSNTQQFLNTVVQDVNGILKTVQTDTKALAGLIPQLARYTATVKFIF